MCCYICVLHVELVRATASLASCPFCQLMSDLIKLWDSSPLCHPRHFCQFFFFLCLLSLLKLTSHLSPFFPPFFSPGLGGGLSQVASQGPLQHEGFHSALPLVLFLPLLSLQGAPHGHLVSFMELSALEGGCQKKAFSLFYTKTMKHPQNNFTNSDLNT